MNKTQEKLIIKAKLLILDKKHLLTQHRQQDWNSNRWINFNLQFLKAHKLLMYLVNIAFPQILWHNLMILLSLIYKVMGHL
jgi:hypothetical protein